MQAVLVAWKRFPPPAICQGAGLLVCGRLGVMQAACRCAKAEGGTTAGIPPGATRSTPILTSIFLLQPASGRNVFLVRTADVVIASGGEYGTLSEIALALKTGKSVVGIRTCDVSGVIAVTNEQDAAEKAFSLVNK